MMLRDPKPQDAVDVANTGLATEGSVFSPVSGVTSARKVPGRTATLLAVLGVALVLLLGTYHDTVAQLASIWNRSDTFAHGFLVAPISLWLMWRRRKLLTTLVVGPSWFGVLFGILSGFAWLLGELASVDSVSQFALVGMVISLVWGVMGSAFVRAYAFPLGFLVFLVPFGEFLFPTMMDWTAHFVIAGLRVFSIPVYAEGRNLVIPSGTWQVVEGCSGVRYLIASVVVGSLYSYLSYRSTVRRLVFTGVSVVLPVFANWVRAWGIVMLGHLSGNKIATGVDHIVYGWVFFGLIMLLLFWGGSRWAEDESRETETAAPISPAATGKPVWGASLAVALAVACGVFLWKPALSSLLRHDDGVSVQFAEIKPSGAWGVGDRRLLPDWSPRYSGMRGTSRSAWVSADKSVGLFIGYYRNQKPGNELINSENRVLISKDPMWRMTGSDQHKTSFGGSKEAVLSTEIANGQGRLMIWHSYWIGGRWTTNDYVGKLYLALTQLQGKGDDSAVVMVFTPYAEGERASAVATLEQYLADMGPSLDGMLASTASRSAGGAR